VCIVAVVVLIPLFITGASLSPRTGQLHNLRLFWSGLDVFELIGMALTGLCLLRHSPYVAGAGTITGTLLISDAWFNIITTVGQSHRAALAMAFVEVPVAVYSFVIARREISSWSVGSVGSVNAVGSGHRVVLSSADLDNLACRLEPSNVVHLPRVGTRRDNSQWRAQRPTSTSATERNTVATATLKLKRHCSGIELRRGRFEVSVDRASVGSIENDDTIEIPLTPGHHTLQIRAGRYSSQDHSFDVADGEVVNFRCHGAMIWPTYVASIVKPNMAISLKQE
jgi:hypothetical protein